MLRTPRALVLMPLLAVLALLLAGPAPAASAHADVPLLVSSSANRAGAVPLAGATLEGRVFVHYVPDEQVNRVSWWVDDPTRTGAPRAVESAAPWDLAGGNAGAANAFDTGTLAVGEHRVTALVQSVAGDYVVEAAFTVGRAAPPSSALALAVSDSPTRSASRPLAGTTLSGNAYIHVTGSGITGVTFRLDDPAGARAPYRVEGAAPWDLAGGTATTAAPLDTRQLAAGLHQVSAAVTRAGVTQELEASFTVPGAVSPVPALAVSTSSARTSAAPLEGATLSGNAYAFVPESAGITEVAFHLDDPSRSRPANRIERAAPWDLAGGTATTAAAVDTTTLSAGTHTLTAAVTRSGAVTVQTATFTVANGAPPPPADAYSYAPVARLLERSTEAQGVVVGSTVYVFGGFDPRKGCCTPTDRAFAYDIPTSTWRALTTVPDRGMTHAGVATDGRYVYLAGGYTANASWTGQIFGSRAVHRYDTVTGAWSRLPDFPYPRSAGGLVWLDGRLHHVGGTNLARTQDQPQHLVLDVAGGATSWTVKAPLPDPRNHLGAVALDGTIYVIGGQRGHDGGSQMRGTVHAYDPQTDTWTERAPLATPRSHITSSTFVLDGRIVVAGGQRQGLAAVAEVSVFDPATNTWSSVTPLPAARMSGVAGASASGSWLYVGGSSDNGWTATPAP